MSLLKSALKGLAVLAALSGTQAQDLITDDAYFYGLSPPVYPSPNTTGSGEWADAYAKAAAFVSQLTLEEKVNLTSGVVLTSNGCSGNIGPIERLNFPGLCLSDAGNGVRSADFVSSWPSGIHAGASWNKSLVYDRARGMASEFKKKGVNILLGPTIGPLGRLPLGGRNWEGFSKDPYLTGSFTFDTVTGIQDAGVIAVAKHFIANEQELFRNPNGNTSAVSSNVDDATLHEMYLWPFQDAVHAGTGSVMCSYQKINGSYACQNSKTQNGILKGELGFQGFVMTDWGALHAGVASAEAGTDMVMASSELWGDNLTEAVLNGTMAESRVDDQATRVMSAWYLLGQDEDFPTPGLGIPYKLTEPHDKIEARDKADRQILFDGAVEGHVLVKNVNNQLPLKNVKTLSLSGYSATAPRHNGPIDVDNVLYSPWYFGGESIPQYSEDFYINFSDGIFYIPQPSIAVNGTLITGGGSAGTSQSTFTAPYDSLVAKADEEYIQLWTDFNSGNPSIMATSDACLVFGNAFAGEEFDRPDLHDDYTDGLILNVAANCSNTIVILHNAGVRLVDQWIEHPNITAVIFAHLPGQDSGKALTSLLFGESEFSGRLPYSVPKNESDFGNAYGPDYPEGEFELYPQSNFTEGVYFDYRRFDAENITVRYEFGFGLTYTTFNYSGLSVTAASNVTSQGTYPSGPILSGGASDLWDIVATVDATVSNSGSVDGTEVAQLYVGIPGGPIKQLRGFEKEHIAVGESVDVSFALTRRDMSSWDTVAGAWKLSSGPFQIYVGSSSTNLPLQTSLTLPFGA